MLKPYFKTTNGSLFLQDVEKLLDDKGFRKKYGGKVKLIITSPPFPLNEKKSYGNLTGEAYLTWFSSLAPKLSELLAPKSSIVVEMGNGWEQDRPVQSLLPLQSLLAFVTAKEANLRLCQEFIAYNPARLPSPAQWVTIERIRATDSFTRVWWMANDDKPTADNSKIGCLRPYSKAMEKLLKRQSYNSGTRPSHHRISEKSFLKDNKGSIAHNVIEVQAIDPAAPPRLPNVFRMPNTAQDDYIRKCREAGIEPHPARMQPGLVAYFVEMLTEPGDIIFDPFTGSNTTGYIAEKMGRKWVGSEALEEFAKHSEIRFKENKE